MLKKLWSSYRQWYITYSGFSKEHTRDELSYFRDKLFISILLLILPLGLVSYIPSAIVSAFLGKWFVFYADTIAFLLIAFLFFNNKMSLSLKKMLFSANLFLLSFALIFCLGLKSSSGLLLFMLCILVTLYSGKKAGIRTVVYTALGYAFIVVAIYFNLFDFSVFKYEALEVIVIVFINKILFILMTVFSVSFLIDQIHDALINEGRLQVELIEKHKNVIIAKEKAEQSDQLKLAFLTNMSHEVRTPMYGILGSAELLKDYEANNDKEFREYISVIEQNGSKLLDVISGLISISEIETGALKANIRAFNINNQISSVYNLFLPKAKQKGVELILKNSIPESNNIVKSDTVKVADVLKNLIENAIKFTSKGGRIIIRAERYNSVLELSIEDTGIGVPEDKKEIIFNSFYQVDIFNKKALNGFGIGLSIAKSYAKLLGGNLYLISKEGIGSNFIFTMVTDLEIERK